MSYLYTMYLGHIHPSSISLPTSHPVYFPTKSNQGWPDVHGGMGATNGHTPNRKLFSFPWWPSTAKRTSAWEWGVCVCESHLVQSGIFNWLGLCRSFIVCFVLLALLMSGILTMGHQRAAQSTTVTLCPWGLSSQPPDSSYQGAFPTPSLLHWEEWFALLHLLICCGLSVPTPTHP